MSKNVVIVPVYNEQDHLRGLLSRLREVFSEDVLFIDDGSHDCSPCVLKSLEGPNTRVITHHENRGYGVTLSAGFGDVRDGGYEYAITMDSDGQHRPEWIPRFFERVREVDVVSGSRYLIEETGNGDAPNDRKAINRQITTLVNSITGFGISDAFCGFKAYRVAALSKLQLDEPGYAMPLQFWVQAKHFGLRILEEPVSRIYDDPNRSFGAELDNPEVRLRYYQAIIEKERKRWGL